MDMESSGEVRFDCIYEANKEIVFKTAMYYSGNYHVAQEISQTAFLKLYIRLEEAIEPERIRPWLLTTTKNLAINSRKKNKRELANEDMEMLSFLCDCEPSAEEVTTKVRYNQEVNELSGEIIQELYEENPRWHEAIMLAYAYEMSQKKVAETMGVSLEVLHSMLYRARKWVQRHYKTKYDKLKEK